jgi:hypothetical protein
MTQIEGLEISRLIAGSNWFLGYSHGSKARDEWIKSYMNPQRIAEVLSVFARNGVNAVMSGPNALFKQALDTVEAETGIHMHWICTPNGEHLADLLPGIEQCAEWGVPICMPHQHWTDGNMVVNEQRIIGLETATERIRELGMIPGLSTHRPETIILCDKAGYDVATYIQIYNAIGFLCQVETDWIARVITGTSKPVMVIKPLAAGRIMPHVGFSFVYNSIKTNDAVCVGTMNTFEAEADIQLAREIIAQGTARTQDLTFSRSKSALME